MSYLYTGSAARNLSRTRSRGTLYRTAAALCLLLLCGVFLVASCRARYRTAALAGEVVRFHVIAEGDSAEEQARKLVVRDALLPELDLLLEGVSSCAEAEARIGAGLSGLAAVGADAYRAAGGTGSVTIELGQADYGFRTGETGTLPAGRYESLRVTLGAGEGHNWWCVLFPDLGEGEAQAAMAGSTDGANGTEEQPELRFFCAELAGRLSAWLREHF